MKMSQRKFRGGGEVAFSATCERFRNDILTRLG